MKSVAVLAVAAMLGMPVLADDVPTASGEIDVAFTWSAIDLAAIPAPDGGTTSVLQAHLVLTSNVGGPIDKLAGSCLLEGLSHGQDWKATGACAFADADGDQLFEAIEETGDKGKGVLTGGSGKFAGITGEHDYTTTWYASIRSGENQGVGVKKGHWTRGAM